MISIFNRYKNRILGLLSIAFLYFSKNIFAKANFPTYHNSSGLSDFGHFFVPSLKHVFGETTATYIWWTGTLVLELFLLAIVIYIFFTGKGIRLGICLFFVPWLLWLLWHATILPMPDDIIWQYPKSSATLGIVFSPEFWHGDNKIITFLKAFSNSLGTPFPNDFWYSGHVAMTFLIALFTSQSSILIRISAYCFLILEILLVLSARAHYSIDILGGLFVGYTIYRVSGDIENYLINSNSR